MAGYIATLLEENPFPIIDESGSMCASSWGGSDFLRHVLEMLPDISSYLSDEQRHFLEGPLSAVRPVSGFDWESAIETFREGGTSLPTREMLARVEEVLAKEYAGTEHHIWDFIVEE